MNKILLIVLLVFSISGCIDNYHVATNQEKEDIMKNLTYMKDKHGLCYSVLARRTDYGYVYSLANVPCDKVGL